MTKQQQSTPERFSGFIQHVKESVERLNKNEELVINFVQELALKGYSLKEYGYTISATSEPILTAVIHCENGDFKVRPSQTEEQTLLLTGTGLDLQLPIDEESTLIISPEKANYYNKLSILAHLKPPMGRDFITSFVFYLLNQRITGYKGHTITGLSFRTTSRGMLLEFKIDKESYSLILHTSSESEVTSVACRGKVSHFKFPQQVLNWVLEQGDSFK